MIRRSKLVFVVGLFACTSTTSAESGESSGSESATSESETGAVVDCSDRPIALPSARGEIEGAWDAARGRMLIFAGDQGTPVQCMSQTEFVGDVWAFHTDCDNFEQLQGAAGMSPRGRYALAVDELRERVLIHGGRYRAGTSGTYTLYDDLWAYELATDTWTMLPAGATPRANHTAVVVDDTLLVYGGNESTDGLAFLPLGDTWAFDLASETWAQVQTSNDPPARLFHAATAGPAGYMMVYGGGDENAFVGPFFNDLWALELATGMWSLINPGDPGMAARTWADMLFDADGSRLLLWGGHDDTQLGNTNHIWQYDLNQGGWSQLELGDVYNAPANGFCDFPADFVAPDLDAPERRNAGAAVLTDAGELLIFGGKTDCGIINDVWSWSLADGTWTERSAATVGEICLRAFGQCQTMCF
jgi:hypothetical protein